MSLNWTAKELDEFAINNETLVASTTSTKAKLQLILLSNRMYKIRYKKGNSKVEIVTGDPQKAIDLYNEYNVF